MGCWITKKGRFVVQQLFLKCRQNPVSRMALSRSEVVYGNNYKERTYRPDCGAYTS
jgi:hypothetical protein